MGARRTAFRSAQSLALAAALAVSVLLAGCQSDDDFGSEGTSAAPLSIGTASTSYEGEVGADSTSYYSVTVTADYLVVVSIGSLFADADLAVFTDSGFSALFCASIHTGTTSESCSATTGAAVTTLYIMVRSYGGEGTSYTLSVTESSP